MPAIAPPTGYKHAAQVTVTGGGAAVNGSTSAPTTSGTDYVVLLNLTGSTAQAVYNGISDTTSFSDVSMWWWNGSAWTQIDCDIDTDTFGAWSTSNIALKFKLQAALAASPATDSNYMLAWGKQSGASITTAQSWANIYPLSDGFDGVQGTMGTTATTLGAGTNGWATGANTGGSVSVSGGELILACGSNATSAATYAFSKASFAVTTTGYCVDSCLAYEQAISSGHNIVAGQSNSGVTTYIDVGVISAISTAQYECYNHLTSTASTAALGSIAGVGAYKAVAAARDTSGFAYAAVGGAALAKVGTTALTSALLVLLETQPPANASQTGQYKWMKVRPFTPVEPTTALGSIVTAWVVSAAATASLASAISRLATYQRSTAAIASLATVYTHIMAHLRSVSRTVSASSSSSRRMVMDRARITTASISRAVSRLVTYNRAHAATVSTGRALSRVLSYLRPVTRTASITSTNARSVSYHRAVSKVASWATAASNSLSSGGHTAWTATATATVSISRSVTRRVGYLRPALRNVIAATNTVRVMTINRSSSATTSITSGVSRFAGYVVHVARSASLIASTARTMALSRAASATEGVMGVASRQMTMARSIARQASLRGYLAFDGVNAHLQAWVRHASATVSASSASRRVVGYVRPVGATVQTATSASYKKVLAMVRALYQVAARVFSFTAAPRVTSFTVAPRNLSFTATGTSMPATPDTNGKNFIASTEKNVPFRCDFTTWLQESETISTATIAMSGVMTSNPGQDISTNAAALLQGSSVSSPVVTVILGNANAMIGAAYTARIDVTTNQGRDYAETIGPIYCTY